jgi:hypothetical protein
MNHILGERKGSAYDPDLAARINQLAAQETQQDPYDVLVIPPEIVTSTPEGWYVPGVEYRGKKYIIKLSRQLLPEATYDTHITNTQNAKRTGGTFIGDFVLYHQLFQRLYILHTAAIEGDDKDIVDSTIEIHSFLKEKILKESLVTLSHLTYNNSPYGELTHHRANIEAVSSAAEILPDHVFTSLKDVKGTINTSFFNYYGTPPHPGDVYTWLSGTESLFRSDKGSSASKCPIAYHHTGKLIIDCMRSEDEKLPALGIRLIGGEE